MYILARHWLDITYINNIAIILLPFVLSKHITSLLILDFLLQIICIYLDNFLQIKLIIININLNNKYK